VSNEFDESTEEFRDGYYEIQSKHSMCPGDTDTTDEGQDMIFWIGTVQTKGYVSYVCKVCTTHMYFYIF